MRSLSVTIRMKATEQFFTVVQFIMLYKVVLTFESVDEILKCDLTIQMKVNEQSFLVVLFIILYQVVLSFESVSEIRKCVSCGTVYWGLKVSEVSPSDEDDPFPWNPGNHLPQMRHRYQHLNLS